MVLTPTGFGSMEYKKEVWEEGSWESFSTFIKRDGQGDIYSSFLRGVFSCDVSTPGSHFATMRESKDRWREDNPESGLHWTVEPTLPSTAYLPLSSFLWDTGKPFWFMQLLVKYSLTFSQKHPYCYRFFCSHWKYTGLNKTDKVSSREAYILVQANECVNFRQINVLWRIKVIR